MTTDTCNVCDLPMHRFGSPADADGHTPDITACLNALQDKAEQLERGYQRLRQRVCLLEGGDLSGKGHCSECTWPCYEH